MDTTPAATIDQAQADSTPDLMGAPPAPDAASAPDGLLGGAPTAATKPTPVTVKPSTNAPPPKKASMLKTWRRPDGTLVTAMRPIPNPKARPAPRVTYRAATVAHAAPAPAVKAPVAHPVAKPKIVAAAPAPKTVVTPPALKPVAPPKVVAPLAKAPTPVIPAAAAPAKPQTKIEKLQAAVAPEATKGAVLAAGESLGKGEAGQVTLSLPASLGDMIKAQAAKLGLAKAAKKTSAYATLQGEGYEVTPNGKQTAVVKPGEPTTFAWQVKPGEAAQGQLKSEFGVDLNGAKTPQSFSLGEIVKRVAPMKEAAKTKGESLLAKLNLKGLDGDVNLPGLGGTPLKSVLGGALVLLAVIILAAISRSASTSKAKAERRRKFRTLTDYGRNDMELRDEPLSTAHVSYVNPMVAAAGGAVAGAALATAVSHGHDKHDDGHADAHAHDDHHGHDDHGHAGDLHAEAHPEPHAPAEHVAYAAPAMPVSHDAHAHDDHAHDTHAPDAHAHAETEAHGHDAHAPAADGHHAKELEHAH